jgi:hypothetical protein
VDASEKADAAEKVDAVVKEVAVLADVVGANVVAATMTIDDRIGFTQCFFGRQRRTGGI